MKKFFNEFKTFISRGNVLDMAVGIIIGGAFTAIVNSAVNDLIMPGIGLLIGGVDFADLKIILQQATADSAEVAILYGKFINSVISFILVALAVFLMVKAFNKMSEARKKQEAEAPAEEPKPSDEVVLLTEIRDLLKK